MSQPGPAPNASHCPECNATFQAPEDVAFFDMESETKIFGASKRFYLVACDHCGAAIGGGVAGAM